MPLTTSATFDFSRRVSIDAPDGPVHGTIGETARIFKGIPYAQPPLGPLRFRPPQPLQRAGNANTHANTNMNTFAAAPMQARPTNRDSEPSMLGDAGISEDCLYLNVWAPTEPGRYPVFVWLHGGSNISGATSQPIYDGTTFARDGVVCVTVGYRLGVFGFLECGEIAGEDFAGSGNNAIRDQILAMQWVRDNIAAFGGDPTRVTLGGESAGAKNVAALVASPSAKGLFQAAILQSGGGETVHSLSEAHAVARSFVTAFAHRYPDRPTDSWRDASAEQLLAVQADVIAAHPRAFAFRSVVDGDVLPFSPREAVQQGAATSLRLLMGWNRDESVLFASPMMLARLVRRPDADFPMTSVELAHSTMETVQQALQAEAERDPLATPFQRRVRVLTAEAYGAPTLAFAEAQARAGGIVYVYRFDHAQSSGPFAGWVPHGSELSLMWDHHDDPFFAALFPSVAPPSVDMHAAWVAFMHTGVPDVTDRRNGEKGKTGGTTSQQESAGDPARIHHAEAREGLTISVQWPAYVHEGHAADAARQVLSIGQQAVLVSDPGAELRAIWDRL